MSELTISAAGFVIQPLVTLPDGPASIRWWYNRAFLSSEGVQVQRGTGTTGFWITTLCAVADGLIVPELDTLLWTTDDAQDPAPGSIWLAAAIFSARGVLVQQLTIAGKSQFVVTESLTPTCTWQAFSNYNQAVVVYGAMPDFEYTAAEVNRVVDQAFDTHPATDGSLGTVLLTVPADIEASPVVWGANDPLVRDAIKLQGTDINDTPPLDTQTLVYDEATNQWRPGNQNPGTGNVISNEVSSVDSQMVIASGTGGKTIKLYEDDGLVRTTGGVPAPATVGTTDLDDEAVTYAKMQDVAAASRLLGRGSAGGAGVVEEVALGSGLSMTGTTLSATGTGGDVTAASNLTDEAVVVGDGGVKGVQSTPVTINSSTGLMAGATVDSPDDLADIANKDFVLQSVAAAVQQTPNISALISGGGVIWESDYIFRVSQATYLIQGDLFSSVEQTVTLDAADVTLDRIDVIALDNLGAVIKVTGVAAAQPSQPEIDPGTQLFLTFVFVGAATTEPANVVNEDIYLDNAEWAATTSGSGWNVASTNNPHSGTFDIEGTSVANNAYVQLQAPSPLTLDSYALLSVFIRSKATWPKTRSLLFQWYTAGVAVGVPVTINTGFFGFDSSQIATYQLLAIPVAQFAVPAGTSLNQLRITDKGGAIGMYIDDVVLQAFGGDIGAPPTPGITQEQADARYAQRALNLSDLNSASTARTNLGLGALATVVPGTGVATALAVNVGSAGSPMVNGGVLGTPSTGNLSNCTALPVGTGISGLGTGVATFLGTPSSANLAAAVTDETGSGALVFGTQPSFTDFITLPNGASPTTAAVARTAFDTDAWAASRGAVQVHDGTANTFLVGVLASDTPSNGQVPTWNTGGTVTWETPSGGGGTNPTSTWMPYNNAGTFADSPLVREDADTVGLYDLTNTAENPSRLNIYGLKNGGTFERLSLMYNTSDDAYVLDINHSSGALRRMELRMGGTNFWRFNTTGPIHALDNTNSVIAVGSGSQTAPGLQFGTSAGNTGWFFETGPYLTGTCGGASRFAIHDFGVIVNASGRYGWPSGNISAGKTEDTALARNSAGMVEVNSGVANTYRDLKTRQYYCDQTITGGGTTGDQVINKAAGTVNIAAAGTTVTVTNSLCSTSSTVFAVIRTNDTTATIKNVVPGAGSFVINLGAAATAEISIGFLVVNK